MNNPIEIFQQNWAIAKSGNDANANYCFLSTVSADGEVSVRTLVFRGVIDNAFLVFINNTSPKWRDLQANGQCELLIFWPSMMQQYRIRGEIDVLDSKTIANHWQSKPYASKVMDYFYSEVAQQSSAIESRDALQNTVEKMKEKYPDESSLNYSNVAQGLVIAANSIEVWIGSDSDRLHDRRLYKRKDGGWDSTVLIP